MREIEFRPRAQLDLENIVIYIAMEFGAPTAANDAANAIYQAIELAADQPELGSPFVDEDLVRPYRRILAKRYWIYYSYTADVLTVHRIFHTLRDTDECAYIALDQ